VTAAAPLLVLGLAACGSDASDTADAGAATSAPASPAATAGSQLCADADAVQASLAQLTGTEILKDGTDALRTNFTAFESSVQTLLASARTDFAAESDAVRSSVEALKTAIGSLTDSPSVADAAAVAAALKPVQESVSTLVTSVKGAC
jgi:hypothetical protein